LVWALLPLWKLARGKRHGLSGAFAPLMLVLCFVIWIALLALGFGLMAFAARSSFQPQLPSLAEAIYVAGSSMMTVGPGKSDAAFGVARWIILAAGFCGLAVMTMAVTYLLEVQGSVARRDTGIIKLNTSAGEPPSATTLLQRFAALGNRDELAHLLRESRDWCATVRQSHTNHPSLVYFRSVGTGAGWPAALGAILDVALLLERVIDEPALTGPAVLAREEGEHMARELARMVNLRPIDVAPEEAALRQAAEQLAGAGYPLRDNVDFAAVAVKRVAYRSCVDALARHLGKSTSVLVRQS
jgi:hypothetical protein